MPKVCKRRVRGGKLVDGVEKGWGSNDRKCNGIGTCEKSGCKTPSRKLVYGCDSFRKITFSN